MCRLFGFRSQAPSPVHGALVASKNSLKVQSCEHEDGWGIAYYAGGEPAVERGLLPAHGDPAFDQVSRCVEAETVVAHVRRASIGAVHLRNAHPFTHGPWTFAHNGTLHRFAEHQDRLEALIAPDLVARIRGETDSERCFYLFLTQLRALSPSPLPDDVACALARTMRAVSHVCDRPDAERSSMNFLVTDGRLMLCSRRGRTLFYAASPQGGGRLESFSVASENLSGEPAWREVGEDVIVGVDAELTFRQWTVAELT